MPRYEFQLQGGQEVIEEYFPVAECPELGSTIVHNGKTYIRILSAGHAPLIQPVWQEYESITLPRNMPGHKHGTFGRTVVSSQAEERNIMAKLGRKRD